VITALHKPPLLRIDGHLPFGICVVEEAYQIIAFAGDHSTAQATAPQDRRPLVFRHMCVVEKAYQIIAFAFGDCAAQASNLQ
jgi:hypothetical protein